MNKNDSAEIQVFASLQKSGRIKITTDRDCLPPDAIKVQAYLFPSYDSILETAEKYWSKGHEVCSTAKQYKAAEQALAAWKGGQQ